MSRRLLFAILVTATLPAHGFQLEQLTCVPPTCGVFRTQMTGNGERIAFTSTCDFVPGSNPDGNDQLFMRDVEGATLVQLTPKDPSVGLGREYRAEDCSLSSHGALATDHIGDRVVAIAQCLSGRSSQPFRMRLLDYSAERGLRMGSWVPCALRVLPNGVSADGKRLVIEGECHPLRGRRRTSRQRLYAQDAPRRGVKRLGRGRCASFLAGLNDTGLVAFNSNCPEHVGPNPGRIVQLVALDRGSGNVRQLTNVPGTGCGGFSVLWDGIIVPPAVSAAGHIAIHALCTDDAGPVLPNPPNEVLFLAEPEGALQQVTFDYCVTDPEGNDGSLGHSAINGPVNLAADGSAIALAMQCGVGTFPEAQHRVLVVKPADTSQTLEVVSFRDPAGQFDLSPPSMDAAGGSLVFTTNGPIGGCTNNDAHQLYVARNLNDPTPDPAVCACRPDA